MEIICKEKTWKFFVGKNMEIIYREQTWELFIGKKHGNYL